MMKELFDLDIYDYYIYIIYMIYYIILSIAKIVKNIMYIDLFMDRYIVYMLNDILYKYLLMLIFMANLLYCY